MKTCNKQQGGMATKNLKTAVFTYRQSTVNDGNRQGLSGDQQ